MLGARQGASLWTSYLGLSLLHLQLAKDHGPAYYQVDEDTITLLVLNTVMKDLDNI